MKKTILSVCLFISLGAIYAQNSYLSIGLGATSPKGDFSSTSDMFTSGYALSGFAIELDGTFFPGSVLGVSGLLGFGSIYSDQDAYYMNLQGYIDSRNDMPGFVLPPQPALDFSSGFWNYVNVMAGPELAAPIWRFQIGVKAMGGFSALISPKREIFYDDGIDLLDVKTKGTDLSLSYMYGGSVLYKLGSGTALRFSADYLKSRADYTFNFVADTPTAQINESSKKSVNIEALQLLFGLCYTF